MREKEKKKLRIKRTGSHDSCSALFLSLVFFLPIFFFFFYPKNSRFYSCGSGWKFLVEQWGNDDKTIKFSPPLPAAVTTLLRYTWSGICWIHIRENELWRLISSRPDDVHYLFRTVYAIVLYQLVNNFFPLRSIYFNIYFYFIIRFGNCDYYRIYRLTVVK